MLGHGRLRTGELSSFRGKAMVIGDRDEGARQLEIQRGGDRHKYLTERR